MERLTTVIIETNKILGTVINLPIPETINKDLAVGVGVWVDQKTGLKDWRTQVTNTQHNEWHMITSPFCRPGKRKISFQDSPEAAENMPNGWDGW